MKAKSQAQLSKRGRPEVTEADITVVVTVAADNPLLGFERINLRDLLLAPPPDQTAAVMEVSRDAS